MPYRYKVGSILTKDNGVNVKITRITRERYPSSHKSYNIYRLNTDKGYSYSADERALRMYYKPHPPGCMCPFHGSHK